MKMSKEIKVNMSLKTCLGKFNVSFFPVLLCLGDLYGSIGSPVRLSRTVVVGRRQELVQRLLYVLTYFIRCSELLETHMLDSAEDEAIVMPGSLITTSLRKGEVEESDYVLVTVHKPSGDYLSQGAQGQQTETENSSYRSGTSLQSSTYTDTEVEPCTGDTPKEDEEDEEDEDSSESQGSRSSVLQMAHGQVHNPIIRTADTAEPGELHRESSSPLATEARVETVLHVGSASPREQVCVQDTETEDNFKFIIPSIPTTLESSPTPGPVPAEGVEPGVDAGIGNQPSRVLAPWTLGIPFEKKPPDKTMAAALSVPVILGKTVTGPMVLKEEEPAPKVTFLIGDSMSPESDTESRRRKVEEGIKKHKKHLKDKHLLHQQLLLHQQQQHHQTQQQLQRGSDSKTSNTSASEDQTKQTKGASALQRVSSKIPQWGPNCLEDFDEYFSLENPVETRTIDDLAKGQDTSTRDSLHKDLLDPSGVPHLVAHGGHSFQIAGRSQGLGLSFGSDSGEVGSGREENILLDVEGRCRCGSTDLSDNCCCRGCSAEQDDGLLLSVPIPQNADSIVSKGDQKPKVVSINDWEIPRNESSDSALGDSETEETEDWQEEVLVPFPG